MCLFMLWDYFPGNTRKLHGDHAVLPYYIGNMKRVTILSTFCIRTIEIMVKYKWIEIVKVNEKECYVC